MKSSPLMALLLVGSLAFEGKLHAPSDPELVAAIRQLDDGDFDSALVSLDKIVKRLTAVPAAASDATRSKDLLLTYLYRGIAYVGLLQEQLAKAAFKEALKYDKELKLDPGEFPPRVVRVFEAARRGKRKPVILGAGLLATAAISGGAAAIALSAGGQLSPDVTVTFSDTLTPGSQRTHTFSMSSGTISVLLSSTPPRQYAIALCRGAETAQCREIYAGPTPANFATQAETGTHTLLVMLIGPPDDPATYVAVVTRPRLLPVLP